MRGTRAAVFAALFLLPLLHPNPAHAGAWTREKGTGLAVANATYYATSEYFDDAGELQKQRHFSKRELNLYTEWGWRDSTTLGANLFVSDVDQGSSNQSLSNTELFLRQRVYHDGERVISLQPLIKLPTLSRHDRTPRAGSKSADAELALLYGETLDILSPRDFSDSLVALRYRSDNLSPQLRFESRLGLNIYGNLWAIPALYVTQSLDPKTDPFVESGDLDYDLTKAEFTLLYKAQGNETYQLTLFDHVAGALTGSGRGISIGYGWEF